VTVLSVNRSTRELDAPASQPICCNCSINKRYLVDCSIEMPFSASLRPSKAAISASSPSPCGACRRGDVYQGGRSFDEVLRVEVEFLYRHAKTPAS
jgi:hypothetical protein